MSLFSIELYRHRMQARTSGTSASLDCTVRASNTAFVRALCAPYTESPACGSFGEVGADIHWLDLAVLHHGITRCRFQSARRPLIDGMSDAIARDQKGVQDRCRANPIALSEPRFLCAGVQTQESPVALPELPDE